MSEERKLSRPGPGGWRCPCCGPPPSKRRKARRVAKRRLRALWRTRIARMLDGKDER